MADYDAINSKVTLTAIHPDAVIAQGTGIVLKGDKAGDEVTITFTDDAADIDDTGLEGVISSTTSIANNPYVIASKGTQTAFIKAGSNGTIAKLMHKAYLNGEANNMQALPLTLDDATGVRNVNVEANPNPNAFFTIDGRKLNGIPNTNGVYVSEGKTIIIK